MEMRIVKQDKSLAKQNAKDPILHKFTSFIRGLDNFFHDTLF